MGLAPSSNVVRVTIGTSGDFTPGDINDDGRVDSLDYVLLRRYVLGIVREFDSEKGKLAADIRSGMGLSILWIISCSGETWSGE